jgi:hypothetical protein
MHYTVVLCLNWSFHLLQILRVNHYSCIHTNWLQKQTVRETVYPIATLWQTQNMVRLPQTASIYTLSCKWIQSSIKTRTIQPDNGRIDQQETAIAKYKYTNKNIPYHISITWREEQISQTRIKEKSGELSSLLCLALCWSTRFQRAASYIWSSMTPDRLRIPKNDRLAEPDKPCFCTNTLSHMSQLLWCSEPTQRCCNRFSPKPGTCMPWSELSHQKLQGSILPQIAHTFRNRTRKPEAVNIGTYRNKRSDWAQGRVEKAVKQHIHLQRILLKLSATFQQKMEGRSESH